MLSIALHHYQADLLDEMRISRGGLKERHHLILELHCEGISGYAEAICSPSALLPLFQSFDFRFILSKRPDDLASFLDDYLNSIVYFEGLSALRSLFIALSMASLDWCSRRSGQPLCTYLNPRLTKIKPLQTYASNIYWKDDVTEVNDDINRLLDLGVTNIKAHLGVKDPLEELSRLDKMSAISRCSRFMLDFNCAYNTEEAVQFLTQSEFSDHEYYWFEELVHPDNIVGIKTLSEINASKLAFGENHYGAQFDYLASLGIGYLMPDLGRSLSFKALLRLKENYTSILSLHNYSSGILLSNTVHVTTSLGQSALVEVDLSANPLISEFHQQPYGYDVCVTPQTDLLGNGCTTPIDLPKRWTVNTLTTNALL